MPAAIAQTDSPSGVIGSKILHEVTLRRVPIAEVAGQCDGVRNSYES